VVHDAIREAATESRKGIPVLMMPQISKTPIYEFDHDLLFANTYPWLFPGGLGDISGSTRRSTSELTEWKKILVNYKDSRFSRDPLFLFHLNNVLQRLESRNSSSYFVQQFVSEPNITLKKVQERIKEGDLAFVGKIQTFSAEKSRGTDSYWRSQKRKLDSWIMHHMNEGNGAPTLFMTLSCAEYWWNDLNQLLLERLQGSEDEGRARDLFSDDDTTRKEARKELIDKHTIIVQEFFQIRVRAWVETVGAKLYGIKHIFIRYEFAAGRGQIHAHMLAITRDWRLQYDFYNSFVRDSDEVEGTRVLAAYAREQLDLTEEKPDAVTDKTFKALSKRFHEVHSVHEDVAMLCDECHMHKCNDFCMRYKRTP
jgi:hypothetical protein